MPTTLIYFDLPGRAEATRVALGIAGVDFEDKRISFPEFAASPFSALPVLQMNGADYTQSTALLRYAGKLTGIYPEDPLTALKVDEVVMMAEDCFIASFPSFFENDLEKKVAMCKSLMEGKLKSLFEGLAARLAANKASPYFVGDSITIADLQVYAVIATFEQGVLSGFPETVVVDLAPSLKELHDHVLKHPKVKAYLDSRKK